MRIGWMINRFHTDNLAGQLMIVTVNMLDKVQLRTGRPDNQNFLRTFQRFSHFVIKMIVFRSTAGTNSAAFIRTPLVVQMLMRLCRAHDAGLNIIRADMHNMCFAVINPYNCVIMGHKIPLFRMDLR